LIKVDICDSVLVKFNHVRRRPKWHSRNTIKTPTFLDMEIQRPVSHPRNKQSLSEIDATINWVPIEKIVNENYPVGQSESGNKAYPPLMLLKAVLL